MNSANHTAASQGSLTRLEEESSIHRFPRTEDWLVTLIERGEGVVVAPTTTPVANFGPLTPSHGLVITGQ